MKNTLLLCLLIIPLSTLADIKILCLGDSLTAGFNLEQNHAYPHLLEQQLKAQKHAVKVVNAGISGSTTASAPSRLRWHLRSKNRADILLLALGANDGLRGLNLQDAKRHLLKTIQLAHKNNMQVLLAGMKIPPSYGLEYTREFDQMYIDIAANEAVSFIPFLLEGVATKSEYNLPDGIHPNADGHQIISQTILKHLLPLLETP